MNYDEKVKKEDRACDKSRASGSALDLCGRLGPKIRKVQLLGSCFRAPMTFYEICIPHGHILIILWLVTTSQTKIYGPN
jgi:hypothetical protein